MDIIEAIRDLCSLLNDGLHGIEQNLDKRLNDYEFRA